MDKANRFDMLLGNVANDNAWIVSGEPACKGGFPTNSGPTMMNPFDDVSFLENGFNCDGCGGTDAPIKDYDIERFEFWDPIKPKEWDMYGSKSTHFALCFLRFLLGNFHRLDSITLSHAP